LAAVQFSDDFEPQHFFRRCIPLQVLRSGSRLSHDIAHVTIEIERDAPWLS
jgi:hypothetical protein